MVHALLSPCGIHIDWRLCKIAFVLCVQYICHVQLNFSIPFFDLFKWDYDNATYLLVFEKTKREEPAGMIFSSSGMLTWDIRRGLAPIVVDTVLVSSVSSSPSSSSVYSSKEQMSKILSPVCYLTTGLTYWSNILLYISSVLIFFLSQNIFNSFFLPNPFSFFKSQHK